VNKGDVGWRSQIFVDRWTAKNRFGRDSPRMLKGQFDRSSANIRKALIDDSMDLYLRNPKSPNEKGIGIPIE